MVCERMGGTRDPLHSEIQSKYYFNYFNSYSYTTTATTTTTTNTTMPTTTDRNRREAAETKAVDCAKVRIVPDDARCDVM